MKNFRGFGTLEAMQWMAVALLVLLFLLSASIRLGEALGETEEKLAAQVLALNVAGRLDAFQRNACGEGACSSRFAVNAPVGFGLSFGVESVVIGISSYNASARTALPLGALSVAVGENEGGAVVSASG